MVFIADSKNMYAANKAKLSDVTLGLVVQLPAVLRRLADLVATSRPQP